MQLWVAEALESVQNTHRVGYDASSRMLSSPHPKICYPFAIY